MNHSSRRHTWQYRDTARNSQNEYHFRAAPNGEVALKIAQSDNSPDMIPVIF